MIVNCPQNLNLARENKNAVAKKFKNRKNCKKNTFFFFFYLLFFNLLECFKGKFAWNQTQHQCFLCKILRWIRLWGWFDEKTAPHRAKRWFMKVYNSYWWILGVFWGFWRFSQKRPQNMIFQTMAFNSTRDYEHFPV